MEPLRDLWREVWAERGRMLMVTLGLVWGTLALSVLMAFGEGTHVAMGGMLRQSGHTMLRVLNGATTVPFSGLPAGRPVRMTLDDAAALRQVPGVRAVCAEFASSARLVAGRNSLNTNVSAVEETYTAIRGIRMAPAGRFLTPLDLAERRRVVVLGHRLAGALFGGGNAIGQTVSLWDAPFLVVGVMAPRPDFMNYNGSDDLRALIPATTGCALRGWRSPSYALVEAEDPERDQALVAALRAYLARRMRFAPDDAGALPVFNSIANTREVSLTVLGTRVFLFLVGALGLAVAAVAVGNVMYVRVEERVKELGLRQALGATPRQILLGQLLEAVLVVLCGGGLGLLVSAALLFAINQIPFDPTAKMYLGEPLLSVGTSAAIAGMLGVAAGVAGWFPARRAAAVSPVEALRHE